MSRSRWERRKEERWGMVVPKSDLKVLEISQWLREAERMTERRRQWVIPPPQGIWWSHVQLWYIRTVTHTNTNTLASPSFIDLIVFSPLACSWEVTKDETWLQAVPKSSHTYTSPKACSCVCVCVSTVYLCVRVCVQFCEQCVHVGVGVWHRAFVWDTMPNVLERMSRTLGCDVLPCWPEPSCGGDLTGCHHVN